MNGYMGYNGGFEDGSMGQGASNGDDLMMMGQGNMDSGVLGGQSLDDILNQNANVMRRQSNPQQYAGVSGSVDQDARRMSLLRYDGQPATDNMGSYQFDAETGMHQSRMMGGGGTPMNRQDSQSHSRRQSYDNMALNTTFANAAPGYPAMMQSNHAYQSPAHPQGGLDLTMNNAYMDSDAGMRMDYNVEQNMGNSNSNDVAQMHLYNQPQFSQHNVSSPMHVGGSNSPPQNPQRPVQDTRVMSGMSTQYSGMSSGSGGTPRHLSRSQSLQMPNMASAAHSNENGLMSQQSASAHPGSQSNPGFPAQPQHPVPGSQQDKKIGNSSDAFDGINGPVPINRTHQDANNQGFKWETPEEGWPSTMAGRSHMQTTYKNAYSSTGFDMLGVLMRVATRPNPQIGIGAVDLSCAFVVCDAEKDDFPIVYCSDNFERLTGYTKHMILGRNCRFLQAPAGNVEPGVRRKYVDDDSVLYLKNMITLRREAQISLINYRRGGQPFMNLLTMIPITWDTDQVKFFVGFQVDLVEQPNAVTNKNPDGSYSINYQRGMTMPRYIMHAPENNQKTDLAQSVPRDDVSTILATYGNGESEYAKRVWDKVLLENTDDVVHVLSLKGLFQWVSPSASRVLEYDASEIIGTALSSICHPSDIVPVTRELKDTSSGAAVNVVFRIRRKHSGYMWFEGHGSLHTEQGKGRKSIILVGRERPVYTLGKSDIINAGGIGENELWSKMSTSGMFLFVSSNVRQLLDRQPDELVMVSIQSLMRTESKADFARILEHARAGKKASVKHELINRRGQVLSAYTTLYPGDAVEGQKPTFIIAQTRLIKFSRNNLPATRPSIYTKHERTSDDSVMSLAASTQNATESVSQASRAPTPSVISARYRTTDGSAATYAGQDGLMIGHQDESLASEDNLFDELRTTKSSSWQYEIRQLEKKNRILAEEVQSLIASKKKRKRRKGKDQQKDCANCHTRVTPEWRRGPSGQRDLCNSCGLRWAKLNGRVSPRASSQQSVVSGGASGEGSKPSASPRRTSSQPAIKMEDPAQSQSPVPGGPTGTEPRESPRAVKPPEGHGAHMEGASGVPDQIDEGVEEPD